MSSALISSTRFGGLVEGVCNGYAILLFSNRPALGAALLAITVIAPAQALVGLAGAGWAIAQRRDKSAAGI